MYTPFYACLPILQIYPIRHSSTQFYTTLCNSQKFYKILPKSTQHEIIPQNYFNSIQFHPILPNSIQFITILWNPTQIYTSLPIRINSTQVCIILQKSSKSYTIPFILQNWTQLYRCRCTQFHPILPKSDPILHNSTKFYKFQQDSTQYHQII